ncbi:MAG: hypothetical protein RR672_12970, partial [Raoultibacter sp.]
MSDTVASAVAAASFWAWLNLFHEMGRNQLMAVYYMDSASFTFNPGGFLCAALPFGLFLGAALYFAAARFGRGALFERVPAMGYFVGLLVLQFLHYAASFLLHAYGLMIIIYVVINAVCAIVL